MRASSSAKVVTAPLASISAGLSPCADGIESENVADDHEAATSLATRVSLAYHLAGLTFQEVA